MIDTICLDAGGTLVWPNWARVADALAVDFIVDSAEVGFEKPDRRLFDEALRLAGTDHSRALHVGDMYHIDVAGARAAGLTPVLVDEANLYVEADCRRIRSIAELPELLSAITFDTR